MIEETLKDLSPAEVKGLSEYYLGLRQMHAEARPALSAFANAVLMALDDEKKRRNAGAEFWDLVDGAYFGGEVGPAAIEDE